MFKIFILEDNEFYFNRLVDRLNKNFGENKIQIIPVTLNQGNTFTDYDFLIDQVHKLCGGDKTIQNDFFEILYKDTIKNDINLYIIDNKLLSGKTKTENNTDNIGSDFLKFLFEKGVEKKRLVLLTNDTQIDDDFENIQSNITFIQKGDNDKDRIIDHINNNFKLPKIKIGFWKEIDNFKEDKTFWERCRQVFNITYTLKRLVGLSFIFGLIVTIKDLGSSLLKTFQNRNEHIIKKNISLDDINNKAIEILQKIDSIKFDSLKTSINLETSNDHYEVIQSLNLAEHVFLNFLPFFIVIGFFSYYIAYLNGVYNGNNTQGVNLEKIGRATLVLNISKKLFISSIIATLILTILGNLIQHKMDLKDFIAPSILLVILIIYLLLFEKASHSHKSNPKEIG